jgi:hypothetical protein
MPQIKSFVIVLALIIATGSAGIAHADCIRSCTARMWVRLTYQPEGQPNTEKKTDALKTTKSLSRDGRAGGSCLPHRIAKAKKRGCTEAVRDMMRRYSSESEQLNAVCEAVQYSQTLIPRANVQDELYPAADWYRIDQLIVRGKRDAIRIKGEVNELDRRRFRCDGGLAVALPSPGTATPRAEGAPEPLRTVQSGRPAPPPPPSVNGRPAPPPPPTLLASRRADLYISEFALSPAVPVEGQPVNIRIGVYNRGTEPAGAFTVKWWPGENYPEPACTWNVDRMAAKGGRILRCRYSGYPSWYSRLNTKVVADTGAAVVESVESNNARNLRIKVAKP